MAILTIVGNSKIPIDAEQIKIQLFDEGIEKNSMQIAKIIQQMKDKIIVVDHGWKNKNYYEVKK